MTLWIGIKKTGFDWVSVSGGDRKPFTDGPWEEAESVLAERDALRATLSRVEAERDGLRTQLAQKHEFDHIARPAGTRLLNLGEIIMEGDLVRSALMSDDSWDPTSNAGFQYNNPALIYCRKITTTEGEKP
jgi:hypothetical protein